MARRYRHRFETSVEIPKPRVAVFEALDDHERLSAHMTQSSVMMAGSSMVFTFDEHRGQSVGSKIRMSGNVLGFDLQVDEVVTERDPPRSKVWETVGEPRLLVIGPYRMGFSVDEKGSGSRVTAFIEYDDPSGGWRWVGRWLGPVYARWCTVIMASDMANMES